METDKRYLIEGLFIIGLAVAAAFFAVWIANAGERDDVAYRIRFAESVSGLALGDPSSFACGHWQGGEHRARSGQSEARSGRSPPAQGRAGQDRHQGEPKAQGITGVVYVELDGGSPAAASLAAATPEGQVPEIAYQKSNIATLEEQLPTVLRKFSALEDKAGKSSPTSGRHQPDQGRSVGPFVRAEGKACDGERAPEAGNGRPAGVRKRFPVNGRVAADAWTDPGPARRPAPTTAIRWEESTACRRPCACPTSYPARRRGAFSPDAVRSIHSRLLPSGVSRTSYASNGTSASKIGPSPAPAPDCRSPGPFRY